MDVTSILAIGSCLAVFGGWFLLPHRSSSAMPERETAAAGAA
jgi:hypothetical protein